MKVKYAKLIELNSINLQITHKEEEREKKEKSIFLSLHNSFSITYNIIEINFNLST